MTGFMDECVCAGPHRFNGVFTQIMASNPVAGEAVGMILKPNSGAVDLNMEKADADEWIDQRYLLGRQRHQVAPIRLMKGY